MLDHPLKATRAAALRVLFYFVFYMIILAIVAGVLFIKGIFDTASMVGQTDKITHDVNTWRIIKNSIRRNRDRWPRGRNQETC